MHSDSQLPLGRTVAGRQQQRRVAAVVRLVERRALRWLMTFVSHTRVQFHDWAENRPPTSPRRRPPSDCPPPRCAPSPSRRSRPRSRARCWTSPARTCRSAGRKGQGVRGPARKRGRRGVRALTIRSNGILATSRTVCKRWGRPRSRRMAGEAQSTLLGGGTAWRHFVPPLNAGSVCSRERLHCASQRRRGLRLQVGPSWKAPLRLAKASPLRDQHLCNSQRAAGMAAQQGAEPQRLSLLHRSIAAGGASIVSALIVNPLDVVKVRAGSGSFPPAAAAAAAVLTPISRKAAPAPRLDPRLTAFAVLSCRRASRRRAPWTSASAWLPAPTRCSSEWPRLAAAPSAAASAATQLNACLRPRRWVACVLPDICKRITHPFCRKWSFAACECVRVQQPGPSVPPVCGPACCSVYTGTWDGLRKIARREGMRVLWRGTDVALMMAIPMVRSPASCAGWKRAAAAACGCAARGCLVPACGPPCAATDVRMLVAIGRCVVC